MLLCHTLLTRSDNKTVFINTTPSWFRNKKRDLVGVAVRKQYIVAVQKQDAGVALKTSQRANQKQHKAAVQKQDIVAVRGKPMLLLLLLLSLSLSSSLLLLLSMLLLLLL